MSAIGFDLGETLIYYEGVPESWAPQYPDAIAAIAAACRRDIGPNSEARAIAVLERYNTRITPRALEVPECVIFAELTEALGFADECSDSVADAFFGFFRRRVLAYSETIATLQRLRARGIGVGVLTDVPYGMNRARVEADLQAAGLDGLISVLLTSVDVGRRKPSPAGFVRLAAELGVAVGDLLCVGNERKDIDGANAAGARSVLIDREHEQPSWGADASIKSLSGVFGLVNDTANYN